MIYQKQPEILVDLAIAATQTHSHLTTGSWVDMGTGSGAIAIDRSKNKAPSFGYL